MTILSPGKLISRFLGSVVEFVNGYFTNDAKTDIYYLNDTKTDFLQHED